MDEDLKNYLLQTLPKQRQWAVELEAQAKLDNVPIMDSVSVHFMMQIIRLKKPERILEIGTAIGYSALRMLEAYPESSIVTIERDEKRYLQAIENIREQNKQSSISVILGDALEKMSELAVNGQQFDFIFIDAAKGQYHRFFELSVPLLTSNGIIISDNVLFRGHVVSPDNAHPRHKNMVGKIRKYNSMITEHQDFTTSIVPIGDGVAISLKNS